MRYAIAVLHLAFLGLPLWILRLAINLPVYLAGLVLIPWQATNTEVRPSKYYPNRMLLQFRARWMYLWGNEEDGIDGLRGGDVRQYWWAKMTVGASQAERIFRWSALRNPANNLRYVPGLSPRFRPYHIRYIGGAAKFYIWQGVYGRLVLPLGGSLYSIGWKFRPGDDRGIDTADTRLPRCDFGARRQKLMKTIGDTGERTG
jgi:hypothetical protein